MAAPNLFAVTAERAIFRVAFGVAHTTLFLINLPVARRGGRIGESYWDVVRGPTLLIFFVDALMATLCLGLAAAMEQLTGITPKTRSARYT